jgi:hypothetical protein
MSRDDEETRPLRTSAVGVSTRNDRAHTTGDAPARPARRRRALRRALLSVGVVVAVGLFFATDAVVRQIAVNMTRDQIEKSLPSDVTAKNLSVTVDGFSVIAQLMTGRLEKVELRSSDVRVQGNRVSASVVARGVPLDSSKPVQQIEGTMVIGQDAVNAFVDLPNGTTVTLRRNEVGLKGTGQILGIDVGYTASVSPVLQNGDTVVLTPVSVSVSAGGGAFDVTRFAKDLVPSSIPICVAQYLPKGVEATGLAVHDRSATVAVSARDLALDERSLQSRGSCG